MKQLELAVADAPMEVAVSQKFFEANPEPDVPID
jgi:hypothetical protein